MFLSEPGKTNYDLEFPFFGFPVRVHPAFFIMPVLFSRGFLDGELNAGLVILMMAAVFFISILIHELGHTVAFRYFGLRSRIVLHFMGGLAIPDSGSVWGRQNYGSLTSNQQIVVSLAGPAAGFLLGLLMYLFVYALGGTVEINTDGLIPAFVPDLQESFLPNNEKLVRLTTYFFYIGIWLNLVWTCFNLLPLYPLDGGQATREIMVKLDSFNGVRHSLILSMATCVLLAIFCFQMDRHFLAFFCGYLAWGNYQTLQQASGPRW